MREMAGKENAHVATNRHQKKWDVDNMQKCFNLWSAVSKQMLKINKT